MERKPSSRQVIRYIKLKRTDERPFPHAIDSKTVAERKRLVDAWSKSNLSTRKTKTRQTAQDLEKMIAASPLSGLCRVGTVSENIGIISFVVDAAYEKEIIALLLTHRDVEKRLKMPGEKPQPPAKPSPRR